MRVEKAFKTPLTTQLSIVKTLYSLLKKAKTYFWGTRRAHARSLANVGENYIFVHIPKNAGSSVAAALGMKKSWHYIAESYRRMMGRPAYAWRFSFAFVRNPWDRFLSLYSYARLEESQYHSAVDPESAPYGKHGDYDLLCDATVEECARYLRDGRLQHDDFINHWRPQSDWLTDAAGNLLVDFVGRVEMIDADFQIVADRLDLGVDSLPVKNTSAEEDSLSTEKGYQSAFTREAREIVASYYQEDINRFGYEF